MTDIARRMARRMRGRSRAVWVSVALVVVAVAASLLAVEVVLRALGRPALLVSVEDVGAALTAGGTIGAGVSAVALVGGIVCLWGALAPGRTHRRVLSAGRAPLVVDDTVIAGAVSRAAGAAAAVAAENVSTRMSPRAARVAISPASGFTVDRADVVAAADGVFAGLGAAPVRTRVDIASKGRLS